MSKYPNKIENKLEPVAKVASGYDTTMEYTAYLNERLTNLHDRMIDRLSLVLGPPAPLNDLLAKAPTTDIAPCWADLQERLSRANQICDDINQLIDRIDL